MNSLLMALSDSEPTIAGKTHSEILAMPRSTRGYWYNNKISPDEREEAMRIVETVRRAKIGAAHTGRTFSEKHKAKISIAAIRHWNDSENRAKMSIIMTGKTRSKESCAKQSASISGENHHNFGKSPSKATRAKMSAAMTGKPRSKESRVKQGIAISGKNNPNFGGLSEEHKAKISAAKMGLTPSQETRAKMSASGIGKVFTKEHKAKLSTALMGRLLSEETRKKQSATKQGIPLEEWEDFVSYFPYCSKFNDSLKEDYRNAYGRVCAYCGKSEFENGKRLSVHHVDGNRNQGCDGHEWFLVPLCRSCNSKGFERKPEYVFLFWLKDIEREHRRLRQ